MKFGKISCFILFGSGQLLAGLALKLKKENLKFLVVTSERGFKEGVRINSKPSNFKQFLADFNIDYILSQDLNNDKNVISKITPNTLGISIGAAWIFNASFIELFKGRLVNLHGTRLPQNRGGGGFSWQILRNNRLGFGVIHQIDVSVDTGPIIKYKEFFYPPSCRIPIDYQTLYFTNTYNLLIDFLEDLENEKEFKYINQPEYLSIYWPRLSTENCGFIDWDWPLKDIELFICAFDDPYKGASTFINNQRVFLKKCFSDFNDGGFHPFQKGIVYRNNKSALYVAAEDGCLIVQEAKDAKGKSIIKKIRIGDRFHTPGIFLQNAKSNRVFYTPRGLKKRNNK